MKSPIAFYLKGESQGHNVIFKGLKMTFRIKKLKKKLYHINQHQKYYKLWFDNFSLRRLFVHIFGKGASARGGDGGERGKQLWYAILSAGSVAKIERDRNQELCQKKLS